MRASIPIRLFGFRWADKDSLAFDWGEVSRGFGIGLSLCHFEEHWSLHLMPFLFNIYVRLAPSRQEPKDMVDAWGFVWYWNNEMSRQIHFKWGSASKIVDFPWAWTWTRTNSLLWDGTWSAERMGWADREKKWRESYPYTYTLKNGEVQTRTATISAEVMEWRWKWLSRLPFPRKVHRYIDVEFDGEVGDRAGSWKGGAIGCSYTLRKNELPFECLRRMERERRFR